MAVILISHIPVNVIAYEKKLILIKPVKEHTRISVATNAKPFYIPDVQQKYLSSFTSHRTLKV